LQSGVALKAMVELAQRIALITHRILSYVISFPSMGFL
jgi:hypothetical protein